MRRSLPIHALMLTGRRLGLGLARAVELLVVLRIVIKIHVGEALAVDIALFGMVRVEKWRAQTSPNSPQTHLAIYS